VSRVVVVRLCQNVDVSVARDDTAVLRLPSVPLVLVWAADAADRKRRLLALVQDTRRFRPPAIVFVDSRDAAEMLAVTVGALRTCIDTAATAALHRGLLLLCRS
jgi:hypothetical protein